MTQVPRLSVARGRDGSVAGRWGSTELFRYVYRPGEPELESPRPYFHPIRTIGGELVSLYRPHDHVWHKGLAWSLCEVGGLNFWGGPSFRRGRGYAQLDNNGRMRHDRFAALSAAVQPGGTTPGTPDGGQIDIDERLSWITPQGEAWIAERRHVTVTVLPDAPAWRLRFATTMHNQSGHVIGLGSATTAGRDNAGYSGLFWRGPRSFSGGTVLTEKGPAGEEELMGSRAPWLGYVGRHDGSGRTSTVLFADDPANFCFPCQWFVRTSVYGCVCPAPFFSTEYQLADGEDLTLGFDVVVADGALDADGCASIAAQLPVGLAAGEEARR